MNQSINIFLTCFTNMLGFNLETYFIMYNICKAVEKLNISLTCMMSLLVHDERSRAGRDVKDETAIKQTIPHS